MKTIAIKTLEELEVDGLLSESQIHSIPIYPSEVVCLVPFANIKEVTEFIGAIGVADRLRTFWNEPAGMTKGMCLMMGKDDFESFVLPLLENNSDYEFDGGDIV